MKLFKIFGLFTFVILFACTENSRIPKIETPPLNITDRTECALDGMTLADYPGPKAQIQYKEGKEPHFFCEIKEMFSFYEEPGRKSTISSLYVQDTEAIRWEHPKGGWIDAREAFYVVGSRKEGSMGPTYAPFKEKEKALLFQQREGGEIKNFEAVAQKKGG